MRCYTFTDNKLVPIEDRVPWTADMMLEQWLAASGFTTTGLYHAPEGGGETFEVHTNQAETAFVATLCPFGDYGHFVYLDSFSDLLDFMARYTPALELMNLRSDIEQLHELAEKAFQAWHGHHAVEVCRRCDPVAAALKKAKARGDWPFPPDLGGNHGTEAASGAAAGGSVCEACLK